MIISSVAGRGPVAVTCRQITPCIHIHTRWQIAAFLWLAAHIIHAPQWIITGGLKGLCLLFIMWFFAFPPPADDNPYNPSLETLL